MNAYPAILYRLLAKANSLLVATALLMVSKCAPETNAEQLALAALHDVAATVDTYKQLS